MEATPKTKMTTPDRQKTIEVKGRKPKRHRALKDFHCLVCNHTFGQKFNYLRHLGLVHRQAEDGQPITDEVYARLAAYNRKSTDKKTVGVGKPRNHQTEAVGMAVAAATYFAAKRSRRSKAVEGFDQEDLAHYQPATDYDNMEGLVPADDYYKVELVCGIVYLVAATFDCTCFSAACQKYLILGVDTLKDIVENVAPRNIITFVAAINFCKISCNFVFFYISLMALMVFKKGFSYPIWVKCF